MRITFGKTSKDDITGKFLFHIYHRPQPYLKRFLKIGRLYRGYIGIMAFWGSLNLDLWIYYPDRELRKIKKDKRQLAPFQPIF